MGSEHRTTDAEVSSRPPRFRAGPPAAKVPAAVVHRLRTYLVVSVLAHVVAPSAAARADTPTSSQDAPASEAVAVDAAELDAAYRALMARPPAHHVRNL